MIDARAPRAAKDGPNTLGMAAAGHPGETYDRAHGPDRSASGGEGSSGAGEADGFGADT